MAMVTIKRESRLAKEKEKFRQARQGTVRQQIVFPSSEEYVERPMTRGENLKAALHAMITDPGGIMGTSAAFIPKSPMARMLVKALSRRAPRIYKEVQKLPDITVDVAGKAMARGKRYQGFYVPKKHHIQIDEFLPIEKQLEVMQHEATHPLYRYKLNKPLRKVALGGWSKQKPGQWLKPFSKDEWSDITSYMWISGRDPEKMSRYEVVNEFLADAAQGGGYELFRTPRVEKLFNALRKTLLKGGKL